MPKPEAAAGILVLAAGRARRFGADKRLAALANGETLLSSTLKSVPAAFQRRLLVLRPEDQALGRQAEAAAWTVCYATAADAGMGHSLAAGINQAMAAGWPSCLVALGDMPYVRRETWHSLAEALNHHSLVVPRHGGQRGNPVGFQRCWFERLVTISGDRGARDLLNTAGDRLHWLDVLDPGVLRDIDRPEQLQG